MGHKGCHVIRNISLLSFLILMSLTEPACTVSRRPLGSELSPVVLPTYRKGTTFIYSDGTWERVIGVAPGMVTWGDYRGNVSIGSPDFIYRRTRWQTQTRRGTRTFRPRRGIFGGGASTLWPLQKGNVMSYSEIGSWIGKDGSERTYRSNWKCEVVDTERISVLVGEFDTWKIVCKRYGVPGSKSGLRLLEVRTWNFAPDVQHYVQTTSRYTYRKPFRRLELLGVLPPTVELSAEARRKMDSSFQQAMERRKRGVSVPWSIPNPGVSGETTPVDTFQLPDKSFCRRYVQNLKLPDGPIKYYGIACRNPQGKWFIPRM